MIWKVADVTQGKSYRLALCQDEDAVRTLHLIDATDNVVVEQIPDALFVTQRVATDLIWRRDVVAIAEMTLLEGGGRFELDAHGVWLTESEGRQLEAGIAFDEIVWATGCPPKFPPC